jgi:glutamate dehydrogenase (NADP+)
MKFLSFEQTFKNSLTGLHIGGGKGGSDFNPKGKSCFELMDFCKNFSIELSKYVSDSSDVPAGDIGVDSNIIDYIFGYYKKLNSYKPGSFTGKSVFSNGSFLRKESTGYGCAYFAQEALINRNDSLINKTVIVSGSGNVAIYLIKKLCFLGARVIACSDSNGTLIDNSGID